jgi:hypothetical protein
MSTSTTFRWKFFRAGGFDQVRLDSGADLLNLDQLDQKLWLALACPTQGLEFDAKTLQLIDTDKDGRIRAPEIIAAGKWAAGCLKNPDELLKGAAGLPLSAINDATPEGQQLLASAKRILANLDKDGAPEITVEDTTDTAKIFAQTKFNGDGIIPADAGSEKIAAVINDIIACLGSESDRSGKPGISQAKADQFFAEAAAYVKWCQQPENDPAVLPLGTGTAPAAAAVNAVRAKVDDYFARCRLATFDARALGALNRPETEYVAVAAKDLSATAAEVTGFPLARVAASQSLPLAAGINPAWAAAMATLQAAAVTPLLGDKTALTEEDWTTICAKLAPYNAWLGAKAGAAVEKLGLNRLREILAGDAAQTITALIAQDKALEPEANAIAAVDKLVRFHRDLVKLLNNFVSFRDFYSRRDKAVFQAGTLYLDQRSCELCVRVEDMGKHAAMAGLSRCYLAYCDCVRKATGEKLTIAAAFTDGNTDNLMVGRNGVFYDRQGRDWDATIVKIVDNPISIRQAFWMPYKKFIRVVEEQIAKRAAAAEAAADTKVTAAATTTANLDQAKPAAAPKKIDIGTVAAIGVAVGGITAALGALLQAFFGLGIWMPLGVVALMLLISGPSMLIAWLKLRQRNLGPLLDANGWAVNAKAKINIPFGSSLTSVAAVPLGAERSRHDPFAENKDTRNAVILLAVLAAITYALWWFDVLNRYIPARFQHHAPAPAAAAPAK